MEKELGTVANTVDRIVEDLEQRAQLKAELQDLKGAAAAQRNSTDVWLARWVRPLALVFAFTLLALAVWMHIAGTPLPQYMGEGILTLAVLVAGAYIGGRSVEKAAGRFGRGRG